MDVTGGKAKRGRPKGQHYDWITVLSEELDPHGRKKCQCCFCPHVFPSMRPLQVYKHLLDDCRSCTKDIKAAVRAATVNDKADEVSKPAFKKGCSFSGNSRSASSTHAGDIRSFTPSAARMTPQLQEALEVKLARAFVHANIPLSSMIDPYLVDFCHDLHPGFVLPGNVPSRLTDRGAATQVPFCTRAIGVT